MRLIKPKSSHVVIVAILVFCFASTAAVGADNSPQVTLNASKVAPREIETLTQRAILRDYKFAWASLGTALESNSASSLNGLFVGPASTWLNERVASQRTNGISSRYENQSHKLDAVFYAPEGDVIELHDTAEYDVAILDGSKIIHSEHTVVHFVVLMTPGADRWVIRQLQSVAEF